MERRMFKARTRVFAVVIALATTVAAPVAASERIADAVGDIVSDTGDTREWPAYLDLLGLCIDSDGDIVTVVLDLAGTPPPDPRPLEDILFSVAVDRDADATADGWVLVEPAAGWKASVIELAAPPGERGLATVEPEVGVSADSIVVRIPESVLGPADPLRVRASMIAMRLPNVGGDLVPDDHPFADEEPDAMWSTLVDDVPDDPDRWIELTNEQGAGGCVPQDDTSPNARDTP